MEETYSFLAPLPGLSGSIQRGSDSAFIPLDLANRDYQEFLAWIAEGNPAPEGWSGPINDPPVE